MKSNENGGVAKKDNNYIKTWDFDGIFKEGHNKNQLLYIVIVI